MVERFLEDPTVELHPAELPIDEQRRIIEIVDQRFLDVICSSHGWEGLIPTLSARLTVQYTVSWISAAGSMQSRTAREVV